MSISNDYLKPSITDNNMYNKKLPDNISLMADSAFLGIFSYSIEIFSVAKKLSIDEKKVNALKIINYFTMLMFFIYMVIITAIYKMDIGDFCFGFLLIGYRIACLGIGFIWNKLLRYKYEIYIKNKGTTFNSSIYRGCLIFGGTFFEIILVKILGGILGG